MISTYTIPAPSSPILAPFACDTGTLGVPVRIAGLAAWHFCLVEAFGRGNVLNMVTRGIVRKKYSHPRKMD
ncbi:MAG: hypothetical protein ACYCT9_04745 [Leptospirillum sp.]